MRTPLDRTSLLVFGSFLAFFAKSPAAFAHREDYLDETLVFLTLEEQEVEPEYWLDYGGRSDPQSHFLRHSLALEYGITNHWMVDGRGTVETRLGQETEFASARIESRYRFGEEGERYVDIAVSGDANSERLADGTNQYGFEPRLILSKDLEALNFTLNVPVELPLDGGPAAFRLNAGARYNAASWIRVGSEMKYDFSTAQGALIPQLWFTFVGSMTIKLGYSQALGQNSENFGRFAIEAEL